MKITLTSLFLALLATSAEAHDVRVGNKKPRNKQPRIVGGSGVAQGEFPFFVSLGDGGCGGSLVGPKVVLTAAHCGTDWQTVWVGGTGVGNGDGGAQEAGVSSALLHPSYSEQGNDEFDIMLLYLDREIRPNTSKQMAVANFIPSAGTKMTVVGGGLIEDDHNNPDAAEAEFIKKLELSMVSNAQCNEEDWYDNSVTEGKNFCAGGEDGAGHCSGDSGGPIFILDGNTHIQTGVVASSERCGFAKKPGVYSATASVYDWMVQNICDKNFEGVMCAEGVSSGGGGSDGGSGGGSDGDSGGVDCGSDSYDFVDDDGADCDDYWNNPEYCDDAEDYANDDGCDAFDSCGDTCW